ncbi:hypothetical protein P153DRAFT_291331 [Dothidotthia symphoricarpi CBS 119687]|uniref:Uncharacterized protein n=1 Tax=Dothidotthia symphoricarpi CBS 119687 TaxID=1392245 RepID=A0A6A6ACA5_9PLEO|nr:uncharacterized protein P153DRAFT_291331 [Dothidotthia symphoricarpi CBS 119687]KAF2129532.1 hypothetical protein P153DRAFT_291331 [Dothidotthia symphoricarpi CBS 119687]
MVHVRPAGGDSHLSSPTSPTSAFGSEHESDRESLATTVPETVMAEQVTNDVVKEAQSVGHAAPTDDTASTTSSSAANGEPPSGPNTTTTSSLSTSVASAADALADDARGSEKDQASAATQTSDERTLSDAAQPETKDAHLNGDSGEHSGAESQQAPGDVSGGSDTDISRPGSVDPSKEAAGHVRASLAKKPSTFKSVNVTKTFLAKSAVSTPVARLGDKAAPAVQASALLVPTARPRLVAKSGSANAPRALGKMNGAGSGPDASKVWNKNQPVPPPPPKQFTDEELKQQYGIHLATRLQADEGGKEAKWADIDDDEDDWAPDTVQWMDGTKSSVAVPEVQPPPPEEPKQTPVVRAEVPVEAPNDAPTTATNTPKPSVTGGTKTILKPGAHTQPPTGKTSLVLKGQPEKPSLVAKPSASEKKSPWATLPPVEKVSPIQINAPQQQPSQQRFSQQDSRGYDHMPPPPAKEIAPDDFSRRDDRSNRELFNSHNGRYEPVHEMRRTSTRDANFRQQPSVLQRPSQDGPAEPSSAFQTSRASADAPTWGRRRNSSNVSGGNGRRMSIDRRSFDLPNGSTPVERRPSQSIIEGDATGSLAPQQPPSQAVSPNVAKAHPASPYPAVVSPVVQDVPTPSAPAPVEDPVEVQKRLMAEKRERARAKKQQEQEAEKKAEAERKERLAKKLAALAPPVEPKSKVKEQSPSRASEKSVQKEKAAPAPVQSPPKPPVPTVEGEVAQYGMMKVHQAQPVKKTHHNESSPPTKPVVLSPVRAQAEVQARPTSINQSPAQPFDTFTRDRDNSSRQQIEQAQSQPRQLEGAIPQGPKATQAQQAAWTPATAPQPRPWTSQVWGPLQTKERALGNGTFNSPFSQGQPRTGAQPQLPAQPSSAPTAPIGLSTVAHPSALAPTNQTFAAKPMYPQSAPLPVQAVAPPKPGPIAPPPAAAAATKGWGDFLTHIRNDDAIMVHKARQDFDRLGGETFRPEIRETYKDQKGKAETTLHDKVGGKAALFEAATKSGPPAVVELKPRDEVNKPAHEVPSPQQALGQATPLQQASGSRFSRFFPRPIETASHTATTASNKINSPPPPPETESHPAFSGDTHHPLVRLPKPSPRVRLPPPVIEHAAPAEAPVSMPPRGQPGIGSRPLAMNPEWQARFNQLLHKPGSAPVPVPAARPAVATPSVVSSKPNSLAVAALSKATLDVRGNVGSAATVSLPNAPPRRNVDSRSKEVITRNGTEALFEDREFGSLPTVKLSKVPHLAANKAAVSAPKDKDDSRFLYKRWENPFTTRRLEAFDTEKGTPKVEVTIHLSTTREPVTKQMFKKYRGGPRSNVQHKPQRTSAPNGLPTNGSKDRSRKPSQQSQQPQGVSSKSSPRAPAANTWSTNNRPAPPPSQPQQQKTWARLLAAPASVN